jgi:hypothetical protein
MSGRLGRSQPLDLLECRTTAELVRTVIELARSDT